MDSASLSFSFRRARTSLRLFPEAHHAKLYCVDGLAVVDVVVLALDSTDREDTNLRFGSGSYGEEAGGAEDVEGRADFFGLTVEEDAQVVDVELFVIKEGVDGKDLPRVVGEEGAHDCADEGVGVFHGGRRENG